MCNAVMNLKCVCEYVEGGGRDEARVCHGVHRCWTRLLEGPQRAVRLSRRRSIHGAKEDDVPVPPLFKTALVWGLFMGVSSNLRYQARPGGESVWAAVCCRGRWVALPRGKG